MEIQLEEEELMLGIDLEQTNTTSGVELGVCRRSRSLAEANVEKKEMQALSRWANLSALLIASTYR